MNDEQFKRLEQLLDNIRRSTIVIAILVLILTLPVIFIIVTFVIPLIFGVEHHYCPY